MQISTTDAYWFIGMIVGFKLLCGLIVGVCRMIASARQRPKKRPAE